MLKKSMVFNSRVGYRIVGTYSVADDMIFIRETQEVDCQGEENNATVTIKDTQIFSEHNAAIRTIYLLS